MLYLRPGTREHFLENLGRDWPELVSRYERQYAGRAYLPKNQVEPVRREVAELTYRYEIADRRQVHLMPEPASGPGEQLELDLGEPPAADAHRRPRVA